MVPAERPLTAIAPAAPPARLSPAELERIKARIRERRAKEEARDRPRPSPPPIPDEPEDMPPPIVGELPVPIATFYL